MSRASEMDATRQQTLYPCQQTPTPTVSQEMTELTWAQFQPQVAGVLDDYFSAEGARARGYSANFAAMWDRLASSTSGGKWLRPRLVHLAYHAFGGREVDSCAKLAASFEMLHAALVVHDDVIDRDFVRRGSDTLGAVYRDLALIEGHSQADAEHAGYSAAIIAGDLLLTGSLRLATSASTGHRNSPLILETVHDAIFASAAGELDDLLFSLSDSSPGLTEVLSMERLKTAVYSFEAPLRAGALMAGQSDELAGALAEVGRDIGIAYQVIDDVLGTFGESSVTGKSVESDLREGKRTILTTYAGGYAAASAIMDAFRKGDAEAGVVRDAMKELGADSYALTLASRLVEQALDKARELDLPETLMVDLTQICNYVLTRRN
ncbi:polyprenyl synthetase family protein [Arthrobacter cryoconiti]|uniref:Polyprenyl synthetase family protein n=1 Tax=Arthrobacter cryoconiti TaxID=748907 RepID=A0ABV8QZD5_9MICC